MKTNYTTKYTGTNIDSGTYYYAKLCLIGTLGTGSSGIPGVWKATTGKNGVETMMTELD